MSVETDRWGMPGPSNCLILYPTLGAICALALAGCGGGGNGGSARMYTVSATVSGLLTGTSVTLSDNGSDNLTVSANGTVAFAKMISSGGSYAISVVDQPTGQTCAVTAASGTVATSNINVAVGCLAKPYSIGGTVSGLLSGDSVSLNLAYDNANYAAGTISANGPFTGLKIPSGSSYSVTVGTQPVGEQCTVSNGSGTVMGSNVTNVGVSCTVLSYKVSAVVLGLTDVSGLVLEDNGGDDLAISKSGTSSFATALPEGQTYQVTVSTQPSGHTCSVLNGGGTIRGANVSVAVICPWHVGYVAPDYQAGATSGFDNLITAFYIDQSTGATTPDSAAPAGNDPWSLAVIPTGGFLYSDNEFDNTVTGYSIHPTTGALNPVPGSPFLVGTARSSAAPFPHSIAIDPQGHFVYVLDWQGDIVAFTINSSTGSLTPLSTTTLPAAAAGAFALTVSSRNVLYAIGVATNPGDATIAAYSVDTGTGAMTAVSGSPFTFSSPTNVPYYFSGYGWAIDPGAHFLYLSFVQNGPVPAPIGAYTVASIDPTTGALTAVSGSPFALTHAADSILVDNTGTYLYGGDSYENLIQEFSIDPSTGVLTEFATADSSGLYLTGIDPSNTFLFVTGTNNSPYSINPTTGVLSKFQGSSTNNNYADPIVFSTTP